MAVKRCASRLFVQSSSQVLQDGGREGQYDIATRAFSRQHIGDNEDAVVPAELTSWISRNFMQEKVAILVSDMCGLLLLMQTYGVIHVASVIARIRQICFPILHHYGALFIATEVDNFFAVFRSAAAAVMAAHQMQKTIQKYNEFLPSERTQFSLPLNGIGIDFGCGPIVDKSERLHGKTFANAYFLGELMCGHGGVLLTGRARTELGDHPKFTCAKFVQHQCVGAGDITNILEAMGVGDLYHFSLESDAHFSIPGVDDNRYLPKELVLLARRNSFSMTPEDAEKLDQKIKDKYMKKITVLVLDFNCVFAAEAATQLRMEFECSASVRSLLETQHGHQIEDTVFLFNDPVGAILGAFAIHDHVASLTKQYQCEENNAHMIKGFGIHKGEVLHIPGTDVHWGDTVSLATKLAQDVAGNSDIMISAAIYTEVRNHSRLQGATFEVVSSCPACWKVQSAKKVPKPNEQSSYWSWWHGILPFTCSPCCDSGAENINMFQDIGAQPAIVESDAIIDILFDETVAVETLQHAHTRHPGI